ncbi:ArsR family transcriptional regulator [Mycobacteroides abscessus]|uniref:Regulatory protein, ArsR family n=3 Tax=Mycobacteroides abscessus TaxID=36809 RepID=B1MMC7_MYCA9|nr:ArsR family transcriptional regulator [Mycobacteroides abscessus]AYM45024.1 ArsR family transcriptional regulator [[Mycobacterium] chelonae subsp. gwanakae]EIU37632.1 regulatory protein, ArsR family [Mycobacteroides abscessus 6G-0125-S]EPZ20835.1 ArsR family transcriptional regulator [Mycobacteroides abscessus V06705]OHU15664.1 ArsR family transcriptional regulator [Mycobacteroides chelonae]OLT56780.1 ArsR family transcriptional regulator [Mycobacteroides abscessus ATCC 19977]RTZ47266.1 Ar
MATEGVEEGTPPDQGLLARVAVHAALADPTRLAIVEALSIGDASPTELQARLSIPSSNLLAHHLGVLQSAGVVHKRRSEGDRRRWYLRLIPQVLDSMCTTSPTSVSRVVFVCTQNSARSQLAAAAWRAQSPIPAESAGTRPARRIHPEAIETARRHGLELAAAAPRRLDDVLQASDYLIVVCDNAHEELPAIITRSHWAIQDPVPDGGTAVFDEVMTDIDSRIGRLAPRLIPAQAS